MASPDNSNVVQASFRTSLKADILSLSLRLQRIVSINSGP